MSEVLEAKQAELTKRDRKGFTLMEMLIVVAIIAVLVAIAIPVFMGQLNRARVAADAANIRSGYASVSATVLTEDVTTATTYYLNSDGSVTDASTGGSFTTQGTTDEDQDISGHNVSWTSNQPVSYEFDGDTSITIVVGSSSSDED